jgi:hypothetical protein
MGRIREADFRSYTGLADSRNTIAGCGVLMQPPRDYRGRSAGRLPARNVPHACRLTSPAVDMLTVCTPGPADGLKPGRGHRYGIQPNNLHAALWAWLPQGGRRTAANTAATPDAWTSCQPLSS